MAIRSQRLVTLVSVAFFAVAVSLLLYSPFCMFTRLKMQINDYGTYTNALWNTAHGEWFRYLLDRNYLRTHLSLTLALLAPLFRVWDHPFLLAVVQWFCGVAGSLLIARQAARRGLPAHEVAAFLFFFIAYGYTQSTLLCDFHGVCLYFVLLPWLYEDLSKQRLLALAPLALTLGLREDAAFVVLPMVLYLAASRRWRGGYVMAAAVLLYGVIAVQVLFPWVNGISLWERRAELVDGERMVDSFGWQGVENRLVAIFWLLLPALPLLGCRALPVLVFPSVALAIVMASPHVYNHSLDKQYPAPVFTLLVLGMIETIGRPRASAPAVAPRLRFAVYLVAATLLSHFAMGRLPVGQRNRTRGLTWRPDSYGRCAIQMARALPKDGVLLTTKELSGVCANRRDLLLWGQAEGREDRVDLAFADARTLFAAEGQAWVDRIRRGEFGVTRFNYNYVVLERGAASALGAEVLAADEHVARTVEFPRTPSHHGINVYAPGLGAARYWDGNGSRAPANLSHSASVMLEPGRYTARFRFRAEQPARSVRGNWGTLAVHEGGRDRVLARSEIEPTASPPREFRFQSLPFEVNTAMRVEPRVTAGDAKLWLDRVIFAPLVDEGA